jgi:hypothetical protein
MAAMLAGPFSMARPPAAATAITAAASEPPGIMSAIYRQAIKDGASGWLDPDERPKYLSKSLVALWAKADDKKPPDGDVGPIDFDLTADTNGLTLKSFAVKLRSESASAATVDVTLFYQKPYYRPGGPAIVTYDFIREDGRWRIDNILTKKWSVRDLLTRWLKDA